MHLNMYKKTLIILPVKVDTRLIKGRATYVVASLYFDSENCFVLTGVCVCTCWLKSWWAAEGRIKGWRLSMGWLKRQHNRSKDIYPLRCNMQSQTGVDENFMQSNNQGRWKCSASTTNIAILLFSLNVKEFVLRPIKKKISLSHNTLGNGGVKRSLTSISCQSYVLAD